MADVSSQSLDALSARLVEVEGYLHLEEKRRVIEELETRSADPDFWNDADAARATMERLAAARDDVRGLDAARAKLEGARGARGGGAVRGDGGLGAAAASRGGKAGAVFSMAAESGVPPRKTSPKRR